MTYERIDDDGLHMTLDDQPVLLDAETIVICTGQEPSANSSMDCKMRGCPSTSSAAPTWRLNSMPSGRSNRALRSLPRSSRTRRRLSG